MLRGLGLQVAHLFLVERHGIAVGLCRPLQVGSCSAAVAAGAAFEAVAVVVASGVSSETLIA